MAATRSAVESFRGEHSLEKLAAGDLFVIRLRRRNGRIDSLYGQAHAGQTLLSRRRTGPFEPTTLFLERNKAVYLGPKERIASFRIVASHAKAKANPHHGPARPVRSALAAEWFPSR